MDNSIVVEALTLIEKNTGEGYIVNDMDLLKYFTLNLTSDYLESIIDYIESEYITTEEDYSLLLKNITNDDPIFINFKENILYLFERDKIKTKKELKLYNYIINKFSIYTPEFIITNSEYAKHILMILYNKYKDILGYNYIMFRFIDWVSSTLPYYVTFKESECLVGGVLSLPFTVSFIEQFMVLDTTTKSKHTTYSYYSQYNKELYLYLKCRI